MSALTVTFDLHDMGGGRRHVVGGRDAWALLELHRAGETGCTPITHPGPRWSGYVHKLRKLGVAIQTITENHSGRFAGHHARYVLRSRIRIVAIGGRDG